MNEEEEIKNASEAKSGILSEAVRKAVVTGMSALFMTEEGIRNVVSDLRIPKDGIASMIQQAERSRRELFRAVTDELKGFLRGMDIPGEVRKALTGLKLEVRAEVLFKENNVTTKSVSAAFKDAKADDRAFFSDSQATVESDDTAGASHPHRARRRRGGGHAGE